MLDRLPARLTVAVLEFLELRDLARARPVSRAVRAAADSAVERIPAADLETLPAVLAATHCRRLRTLRVLSTLCIYYPSLAEGLVLNNRATLTSVLFREPELAVLPLASPAFQALLKCKSLTELEVAVQARDSVAATQALVSALPCLSVVDKCQYLDGRTLLASALPLRRVARIQLAFHHTSLVLAHPLLESLDVGLESADGTPPDDPHYFSDLFTGLSKMPHLTDLAVYSEAGFLFPPGCPVIEMGRLNRLSLLSDYDAPEPLPRVSAPNVRTVEINGRNAEPFRLSVFMRRFPRAETLSFVETALRFDEKDCLEALDEGCWEELSKLDIWDGVTEAFVPLLTASSRLQQGITSLSLSISRPTGPCRSMLRLLPNLAALSIQVMPLVAGVGDGQGEQEEEEKEAALSFPQLHSLEVDVRQMDARVRFFATLAAPQLKKLTIHYAVPNSLLPLLRAFPGVEALELKCINGGGRPVSFNTDRFFTSLRRLTVERCDFSAEDILALCADPAACKVHVVT